MGCGNSKQLDAVIEAPYMQEPSSGYKPLSTKSGSSNGSKGKNGLSNEAGTKDASIVPLMPNDAAKPASPSKSPEVADDPAPKMFKKNQGYTQSVRQLVAEGIPLQTEFTDKKALPLGTKSCSFTLSEEEIQSRRETLQLVFPHESAYPDMSVFGVGKVRVDEITWDLDCFDLELNQPTWQFNATIQMFDHLGLLQRFQIEPEALVRFLYVVHLNYNNGNPFHNWLHAWSVMHASYLMILAEDIASCLTDTDRLAIMLAAVCHDLDHPGVNNDFLSKSVHPLSRRYKAPILERHHLAMCGQIVCDAEKRCNVTMNLTSQELGETLKMIDAAIMATDMGVHKDICTELQARAEQAANAREKIETPTKKAFEISNMADRVFLVRSIVHTADLSGQAMRADVAYKFGAGCLVEFHNQYGRESAEGLPQSGYMKNLHTPLGQAKAQLGFISFVVLPIWSYMGTIFESLRPLAGRVQARMEEIDFENIDSWLGAVKGLPSHDPEPLEQEGVEEKVNVT